MEEQVLEANHAFVREQIHSGATADFTTRNDYDPDRKPPVGATFLRRLILAEDGSDGPAPQSVRVKGARVLGALDLRDCRGAGDTALPALSFLECDLPDRIDVGGARLARLSIRGSRFRELWCDDAKIDGGLMFSRATPLVGDDGRRTAFIWALAARIGGGVVGRGAVLKAPEGIPEGLERQPDALNFQSAEISGYLYLDNGFAADGGVMLLDARIRGSLSCDGARFANPGGAALMAQNVDVGGSALLRTIAVEGTLFFIGAKVAGDVVLANSEIKHKEDYALLLNGAGIDGALIALANAIDGAVSLAGARIGRLVDDPATAWGTVGAIELDELSYGYLGASPNAARPPWRNRVHWLKRNTRARPGVRSVYSSQPWRECASAFQRAGFFQAARRIAREEQREANRHRDWLRRPFYWLFAELPFGFGLSVTRTTITCMAFWLVGWAGTEIMLSRGALIEAEVHDGAAAACSSITGPLYALDTAIPVLDLGQEPECKPGRARDSRLGSGIATPFGALFEEVALWRWAKALYALAGAVMIGFAILVYSGVFRPKA